MQMGRSMRTRRTVEEGSLIKPTSKHEYPNNRRSSLVNVRLTIFCSIAEFGLLTLQLAT